MLATLFWIFVDLIPFFVAFQIEPPALGFSIGFVLALLIYLFQKKKFGEVTTIIAIKVFLKVVHPAICEKGGCTRIYTASSIFSLQLLADTDLGSCIRPVINLLGVVRNGTCFRGGRGHVGSRMEFTWACSNDFGSSDCKALFYEQTRVKTGAHQKQEHLVFWRITNRQSV